MGRAPCCEKMGLKKGPWSPEEDQILINYINTYGHANWRALPKHAGLLRCGKSCRLRWTNYLRPDIKRGNFTKEEEDAIIDLHEKLGNRWSAIAGKLPGRTDNEIKNVWHTHLKKRLPQYQQRNDTKRKPKQTQDHAIKQDPVNFAIHSNTKEDNRPLSPPQCSSDMSTLTMTSDDNNSSTYTNHDMSINNNVESPENNLALDEDFWSEVLSSDHNSNDTSSSHYFEIPLSPLVTREEGSMHLATSSSMCYGMDFWYDVYARADELTTELLEL